MPGHMRSQTRLMIEAALLGGRDENLQRLAAERVVSRLAGYAAFAAALLGLGWLGWIAVVH